MLDMGYHPLNCWLVRYHRSIASKPFQASYPQEINNTLRLMRSCTWVIGHGEVNLVPSWKSHSCWPVFMVLEGSLHLMGDKPIVLPICESWELHKPSWCNVIGTTNLFLIGFKAYATRWNSSLVLLPGPKIMVGEVMTLGKNLKIVPC